MCEDLYKNQFDAELKRMERKWEFRYEQQRKKQKELEETISKLRKQILDFGFFLQKFWKFWYLFPPASRPAGNH